MSQNLPSKTNSDSGNHLNVPVLKPSNYEDMKMMRCLRKKKENLRKLKGWLVDLAIALALVSAAWLPALFSWNS